jgi:hypothetical protein
MEVREQFRAVLVGDRRGNAHKVERLNHEDWRDTYEEAQADFANLADFVAQLPDLHTSLGFEVEKRTLVVK